MLPKLKPKDLIAALTLIGIAYLKLKGLDGELDSVGALILGYYFVKREDHIDKGF